MPEIKSYGYDCACRAYLYTLVLMTNLHSDPHTDQYQNSMFHGVDTEPQATLSMPRNVNSNVTHSTRFIISLFSKLSAKGLGMNVTRHHIDHFGNTSHLLISKAGTYTDIKTLRRFAQSGKELAALDQHSAVTPAKIDKSIKPHIDFNIEITETTGQVINVAAHVDVYGDEHDHSLVFSDIACIKQCIFVNDLLEQNLNMRPSVDNVADQIYNVYAMYDLV